MKRINKYIIYMISFAVAFTACNDDFLERVPQTAITGVGFFKTVGDLQTYTNGLYGLAPGPSSNDRESDNVTIYTMGSETWNMIRGTLSADNISAGNWNNSKWNGLRSVNYMLQNLQDVTGSEDDIRHYVGIARLFRANFYIDMVNRYSDVPWTNKALASDDPEVYKTCDPRTLVVDSIMADLEYAAANISTSMGNKTRIHKYAALALLSRFSLYEGTYRKYHPELNLAATANRFLERAVSASEEIMNSQQFEINGSDVEDLGNGINASPGYRDLFSSLNLSGNKEIILWQDCSRSFNQSAGGIDRNLSLDISLSRSLMESYLMKDGSRFTQQPNYDKKTYTEVCVGRDPRFAEVFAYPGYSSYEGLFYARPNLGGYGQVKTNPRTMDYVGGGGVFYAAMQIFRYAEVLLNYAEAKAELGTLSQSDLNKSITLLRNRVEMPPLDMAAANASVDPILAQQYPNVDGGANKGALLEIRRERRVELAGEGLRLWDLHRWYAGRLFGQPQQGMYLPGLGAYDVTGDGEVDVAVLERPGAEGPIAGLPDEVKAGLSLFYLYDETGAQTQFYLSNGTSGYIMLTADQMLGKEFIEPKYYYRPIPISQIVLNPELKQPFDW
ncbi:MAG: RagB/SusD family nutrient uptake outer membrane protein [Prevotellaceae bacterium]|jgi:hypothetical protein|nr:RagB/SusD family nutrient uptake outer membrane protein [Prevotellaceae bacterium]